MAAEVPSDFPRQLRPCSERFSRDDIAGATLFEGVELAFVWGILERCPYFELDDGQTLISPADSVRKLYVILSGTCSVHIERRTSEAVATIPTGSSVGELSIIDDSPPSAFVIARGACRVLAISPDEFWALLSTSREIAINLLAQLAQRLRGNNATVSQSRRLQQEYKKHASVDGLTGVHNRRRLDELLPRYLGRVDHGSGGLCLVMTDIDHFKSFNDTYGHGTGDEVLLKVAQVLETRSRPTDFVARYGGEEFTVVLPTTNSEQALMVAERLRSSVEQLKLTQKDGTPLPTLTISLGIAQALPGESPQSLLERADKALYSAKKGGRNRAVLAPSKALTADKV